VIAAQRHKGQGAGPGAQARRPAKTWTAPRDLPGVQPDNLRRAASGAIAGSGRDVTRKLRFGAQAFAGEAMGGPASPAADGQAASGKTWGLATVGGSLDVQPEAGYPRRARTPIVRRAA
jgi:hypothetical protein